MTEEMMALRSMLEKGGDADVLRDMVGFAAQRLMELEVQVLVGGVCGQQKALERCYLSRAFMDAGTGFEPVTFRL